MGTMLTEHLMLAYLVVSECFLQIITFIRLLTYAGNELSH